IFPLLVRAIGVIASIISTYSVRAGDKGTAAEAMKSVNKGFLLGSLLSIAGFLALGWFYLRFDEAYINEYQQAAPGYKAVTLEMGKAVAKDGNVTADMPGWVTFGQPGLDMRPAWTCLIGIILAVLLNKCTEYYTGTEYGPVKSLAKSCQTGHATNIIQGFA